MYQPFLVLGSSNLEKQGYLPSYLFLSFLALLEWLWLRFLRHFSLHRQLLPGFHGVWWLATFLLLAALGLVLHRFAFNNEHTAFIMELPLYHVPNLRTISMYVWQNIVGFLEKAGKVILVSLPRRLVFFVFSGRRHQYQLVG